MVERDGVQLKPFLLMAGEDYYPRRGERDWLGCFATLEEAESKITKDHTYMTSYVIDGHDYDWVEIVDLRDWIF